MLSDASVTKHHRYVQDRIGNLEERWLSERVMEDLLFGTPALMGPILRPWVMNRWLGRQMVLPCGVADLVGLAYLGEEPRLVVVELKRQSVTRGDINQVCDYASDLDAILDDIYRYTAYISRTIKVLIGEHASKHTVRLAQSADVIIGAYRPRFDYPQKYVFTEDAKREYRNKIYNASTGLLLTEFHYHALRIEQEEEAAEL